MISWDGLFGSILGGVWLFPFALEREQQSTPELHGQAGLPCPGSSAGAESEGEVALRDLRITELRWRIFFALTIPAALSQQAPLLRVRQPLAPAVLRCQCRGSQGPAPLLYAPSRFE